MMKFISPIKKYGYFSLDRKIKIMISVSIITVTVLLVALNSFVFNRMINEQTRAIVNDANSGAAQSTSSSLNVCRALYYSININDTVQEFLSLESTSDERYWELTEDIVGILQSAAESNPEITYIALKNNSADYFAYSGRLESNYSRFISAFQIDYQNAKPVGTSTFSLTQSNAYVGGSSETINIYMPMYDTMHIAQEEGLLCIGINSSAAGLVEESDLFVDYDIIDKHGYLLGSDEITYNFLEEPLSAEFGSFTSGDILYIYEEVEGWPYYSLASVSQQAMNRTTFLTNILVVIIAVIILAINHFLVDKGVRNLYTPLKTIIGKMNLVADGNTTIQADNIPVGEDLKTLNDGFNTMVKRIDLLMKQIKEEEQEISEIRLKLLQSQIQPHFLYNTLECIHWQAKTNKDEKSSTLIKALSKYYRICLSEGEDIISLAMELEHSKSYIIIQNIRYGDIVKFTIDIPQNMLDAKIPKITLQPLLENAIYHGIKIQNGRVGNIAISAENDIDAIEIKITDNGVGMSQNNVEQLNNSLYQDETELGFGIANVHRRLQLTFGERYGLNYSKNAEGGITVTVRIPRETRNELLNA